MSAVMSLNEIVSEQGMKEIDQWISKYPEKNRQSAVMTALRIVQDEHLFLTREYMDCVADYLGMEPISVYEVATFYSMYELKPVGRHKICVCTNVSCMLNDSESIVNHLENKLNIKLGQTTDDNMFTLKEVECLGACGGAPAIQVGRQYYENITTDKIDELIETLRRETGAVNSVG